jgi:hypothetical protein
MTDEEKHKESTRRVRNPPTCKCGYRAELVNPSAGLDYTSFFHCPIPLTVILDKMLYICCDRNIECMYTTLTCTVLCRVTNEGVILMNLFTVQGHSGPMT